MNEAFAANMRDAQRLVKFRSRAEFRALPLEDILVPFMNGPVLQFDDDRAGDAVALNNELYCRVDGRLGLCVAYLRTADGVRRALLAAEIRELWSTLVGLATGYTWPDADHYGVRCTYEFAPDA